MVGLMKQGRVEYHHAVAAIRDGVVAVACDDISKTATDDLLTPRFTALRVFHGVTTATLNSGC